MPGGVEWWEVTTWEDLRAEADQLGLLALDFEEEAKAWTHPAARTLLQQQALQVGDWAQEAALGCDTGDALDRRQALTVALGRREAAEASLQRWRQRGELWNGHRQRPAPETARPRPWSIRD